METLYLCALAGAFLVVLAVSLFAVDRESDTDQEVY